MSSMPTKGEKEVQDSATGTGTVSYNKGLKISTCIIALIASVTTHCWAVIMKRYIHNIMRKHSIMFEIVILAYLLLSFLIFMNLVFGDFKTSSGKNYNIFCLIIFSITLCIAVGSAVLVHVQKIEILPRSKKTWALVICVFLFIVCGMAHCSLEVHDAENDSQKHKHKDVASIVLLVFSYLSMFAIIVLQFLQRVSVKYPCVLLPR
jgi:hypothetical protein